MKNIRMSLLAVLALTAFGNASADIGDALDSMYVATGNEPAIYDSQRRMGFDAGYLRLRSPVITYNVVNFSPPRFDVGCGGLDLYGGSFSFINAEQFRQMLRQIGANALGYAFKLALSSMCHDCAANLTQMMNDMAEKINLQVDTCKWGAGLAINGAESLGFKVDEKYKKEAAGDGSFDDVQAAWNSLFSDPGTDKDAGDTSGANPAKNEYGNWTWNALRETDAGGRFAFVAGNIGHDELLMNIAGTMMLRAPAVCDAGAPTGDLLKLKIPRLSYKELKEGKTQSAGAADDVMSMLTCQNPPACTCFNYLAEWSFDGGTDQWVRDTLQAAADHMANPATASVDHPIPLRDFIASLPFSVMRHMLVMQGNQAGLDSYVNLMSPYVSQVYAGNLALQMTGIIRNAYDDSDVPELPEAINTNLMIFEEGARGDIRAASTTYADVWFKAEELVKGHSRRHGEPGFGIDASNE